MGVKVVWFESFIFGVWLLIADVIHYLGGLFAKVVHLEGWNHL